VQGLERALGLLRRARSVAGANSILEELGFCGPSLPLDRKARATLGLPDSIRSAEVLLGSDCLRGLVMELDNASELRGTLGTTARALSTSAPQFLWIVCAFGPAAGELAIACWTSARSRVRVASLVCRTDKLYASDAETLCALSAIVGESDLVTHSRWLDVLGRQAITRRFFYALKSVIAELADSLNGRVSRVERDELALLYISRLIFLCFLETRGWLNGDFGFLSNG
jgi:hypothetical protein